MSSLIVEVCEVKEVVKHPKADRLDLVTVKGWTVVSQSGESGWKVGDLGVYFPPDTLLPKSWTDKWDITKYTHLDALSGMQKIKSTRLRGERSEGVLIRPEDPCWGIGCDVALYYGDGKYEPPPLFFGNGERVSNEPDWFRRYTDIENIQNYPDLIQDGEIVVITEKLHGTNSRMGYKDGEFVCGSHRRVCGDGYYCDFLTDNMKQLLAKLGDEAIVYGEIIGAGIQDMTYGLTGRGYRAFDIAVRGEYLNYEHKMDLFLEFGIHAVPFLYYGPFDKGVLCRTDGPTMMPGEIKCKFKGREGIVITPVVERRVRNNQRVILKSVSVDYRERKGATDSH